MKRKKVLSVLLCIWRAAVTCAAIVILARFGSVFFEGKGLFTLAEELTVFSAKKVIVGNDEKTEVSYFETTGRTSETSRNSISTTQKETTTTVNTTESAAATLPTGENILAVSEEQLIKGTIKYEDIQVKNGNKNHSVDIKSTLKKTPKCNIETDGDYQVLIIHTHTTEKYAEEDQGWYDKRTEWRTADDKKNITVIGKILADKLNESGIRTLHVTEKHDYPKYNGAYSRAKETIAHYLKEYPSIKMVIDVHRDSITRNDGTKVKPTAIIDGKKAAQVMIISGCDDEGDLDFPNWENNLIMAVNLQKKINDDWPGLARPLYFAPFRYNMHMTDNSLLLEFGTEVNTLEEAKYTASLVGKSLSELLSGYIEE